ncbi:MAG: hypothetical protein LC753_08750 [Acidobacteria bacterium]|nr:hypothetical protein [Acidobacteriota bacterium]
MERYCMRRAAIGHVVGLLLLLGAIPAPVVAQEFEIWVVDQSNSSGKLFGGAIYVYDGADLMGEAAAAAVPAAVIDLSAATSTLCLAATGANPVRPHMVFFNAAGTHAVLAFVASGHVAIFDAATRMPVACLRMSPGAGGSRQAHAAIPAPNDRYILVANQNGKLLERIDADYGTNSFILNPAATLNLATCNTPNGVACQLAGVRPDNAPICPIIDATSSLGFVTLRGGGLLVVNPVTTPMSIVAEYDTATVHGNGCGGIEAGGGMFLNSGGGTAANLSEFDLYRFPLSGYSPLLPPNSPAPVLVFSDDTGDRDAHGIVATGRNRYLWVFDRVGNIAEVFDVVTLQRVTTVGFGSDESGDAAPDLGDLSPSGNRMFISLRGPTPLTGDPHSSTGESPGIGVVQVEQGGAFGFLKAIVRINNVDAGGVERADPHAIRVRRK